jgi:EAL domain-containing protein (putative c-di-GMP-specific phosphodiesterase class I)
VSSRKNRLKAQNQWRLQSAGDTDREWMVAIEPMPFIIGRGEECNLKLAGKWISRLHSEIRTSGEHLWIRDLGSKNGTFVNNEKIEQAELLSPGDTISIGNYRFNVKKVESKAASMAEETCAMDLTEETNYAAALEPKLRALLNERNVIPHFQPIYRLPDSVLVGYEVLGRIHDKDLPSNPAELLDLADLLGCAADLSALFREVGVEIGKTLPKSPLLFVNTTPFEIYKMDILLKSLQRISEMGLSNRIILEINEKAATDINEMSRLREALRILKLGLAFDDFGVGQTRLVDLAKVPPDYLKFDISLIREIHLAPKRLIQMVATFVRATQDLGIVTLAEGVECQEEADKCRYLGFDLVQGFFYGKPQSINQINENSTT